ncbi:hypothetical protein ACWF0M_12400 [Kribbella sp. NPDC055110]
MPAIRMPSGASWWKQNQSRYPNSRDIDALAPGFRDNVSAFIAALRSAGASVVVSSTRRSPERAYLMHYSWNVANGQIEPGRVPVKSGVLIDWDHGDDAASRKGAQEMVDLFHMAHIASLTSNHTRGTAVDMTIAWKAELSLPIPAHRGASLWRISTSPRTGASSIDLHEVGANIFGVRKLASDPPHWSKDGR